MVDKTSLTDKIKTDAEVAELADALRSGRSEPWAHEGSNPSFGTIPPFCLGGFFFIINQANNGTIFVTIIKKNFGTLFNMKKILKDKRIIVVGLVIILVLLLMDFNQRMVLLTKMRGQEEVLEQEYAQLQSTREALETQIAFANSDLAVEKWAREEGGMVQEGDIPIILLPPSDPVPTQAPQQATVVDEVEKWQIWQELFFGD